MIKSIKLIITKNIKSITKKVIKNYYKLLLFTDFIIFRFYNYKSAKF